MGDLYSGQKEKVIAVCIAGSDEYAQTAYIDAMCELAQKYKCKILFFTSFSGTCMIEKYYEGEMEIYSLINELKSQGMSIIMVSSELPEVLGVSDRIMVLREGQISGVFEEEEATEVRIMEVAT